MQKESILIDEFKTLLNEALGPDFKQTLCHLAATVESVQDDLQEKPLQTLLEIVKIGLNWGERVA